MSLDFVHGASFVKAALQVNPYQYLVKNSKKPVFRDEESYNKALVERALKHDIRLIAIADHYAVKDSVALIQYATTQGLIVFPGFEAVTSEGIHVLCLFDPGTPTQQIERCIGECGVRAEEDEKGLGDKSLAELLELASKWNSVMVAAHITGSGGLLVQLEGKPRERAWTNDALMASALSTKTEEVGRGMMDMINGRAPAYKRLYPMAMLYAADVIEPTQLDSTMSWSWVKLSEPTIDGLRHAFLDPDSRVRLPGQLAKTPNRRITSIAWKGGFLDGLVLSLNPALNVLVGPRGSGKSTVMESIRFALDCEILGSDAQEAYDGFVSEVLRAGTEVSLEAGDAEDGGPWRITRTVHGGDSIVIGPDGVDTELTPADVLGRVEVFGQHEVAELARLPVQRSRLLERFISPVPPPAKSRADLAQELATNRDEILATQDAHARLSGRLESLPVLENKLEKYRKVGVKKKLEREAGYRKEEPLLRTAQNIIDIFENEAKDVRASDSSFLAEEAIKDLPSRDELATIRRALENLEESRQRLLEHADKAIVAAREQIEKARSQRSTRRDQEKQEYLKKLRELQTDNVDGERYLALEEEHATLVQEKKKLKPVLDRLAELKRQRQSLIGEWYGLQQREYDRLRAAAKQVTKELRPSVRVVTTLRGDRTKLRQFLREHIQGQLDNVVRAIETIVDLDPRSFAEGCRKGPEALSNMLGIGGRQVEKTCELKEADLLELEELWLDSTTSIELKVGEDARGKPIWRGLEHLSTGQKATAILLVLLLDSPSSSPLLVDQPEDDLDNTFIADDVVPKLRSEKHGRQFLLSTHNPNIPVLGDAEQVIRLTPEGEAAAGGKARVDEGHAGSLDRASIRAVLESLEGGRKAFERRRRRYGY